MQTHETQLSKWWKTKSCELAMARAKQRKKEQIEAMKKKITHREAELHQQIFGGLPEL